MTKSELEELVLELKEQVDGLIGYHTPKENSDNEWIWDRKKANQAANSLKSAFDWEECPYDVPDNWEDLCEFLHELGNGSIE